MADTQQKRNKFIRGARALGQFLRSRPTSSGTGLAVEEGRPAFTQNIGGLPRPFPGIRPRATTQTVTSQGPPRGASFLADFLTGLGPGGPEAVARQQQARRLSTERNLQNQLSQGRASLETLILQLKLAPKVFSVRGDLFVSDPLTGKVKKISVQKRLERGDVQGLLDDVTNSLNPPLTPAEVGSMLAQAKLLVGLPVEEATKRLGDVLDNIQTQRDKEKPLSSPQFKQQLQLRRASQPPSFGLVSGETETGEGAFFRFNRRSGQLEEVKGGRPLKKPFVPKLRRPTSIDIRQAAREIVAKNPKFRKFVNEKGEITLPNLTLVEQAAEKFIGALDAFGVARPELFSAEDPELNRFLGDVQSRALEVANPTGPGTRNLFQKKKRERKVTIRPDGTVEIN